MEKYRLRQDVILTEICGEYLLVATPQAESDCKFVKRVNETGGKLLSIISHESLTLSEISLRLSDYYDVMDDKELWKDIAGFLTLLKEQRYIVIEE